MWDMEVAEAESLLVSGGVWAAVVLGGVEIVYVDSIALNQVRYC